MTQPNSDAAQFAAFQQWQRDQAGAMAKPTVDEIPDMSLADVLKVLVRSARLPDQNTEHKFCSIIDAAFPAPSESDSEAAEG